MTFARPSCCPVFLSLFTRFRCSSYVYLYAEGVSRDTDGYWFCDVIRLKRINPVSYHYAHTVITVKFNDQIRYGKNRLFTIGVIVFRTKTKTVNDGTLSVKCWAWFTVALTGGGIKGSDPQPWKTILCWLLLVHIEFSQKLNDRSSKKKR